MATNLPKNTPPQFPMPPGMTPAQYATLQAYLLNVWKDLRYLYAQVATLTNNIGFSKIFVNSSAGFVVRARPNGNRFRFWVDDSDTTPNPVVNVEPEGSPVTGDHLFPSSAVGPVQYGLYRGSIYRWWVGDTDVSNPTINLESVASVANVLSDDYFFNDPGARWVNTARPNLTKWAWFPDDQDGSDLANVKAAVGAYP